jgi:hypothetical protein
VTFFGSDWSFYVLQKTLAPGLAVVKESNQQLSFSDTRSLPHLHLELKWHALVLMSLNAQERTEMKSIYAIALAGIVSLLAINGSMAQADSGQTGGNAAGQGAGSQAGGGGAGGAGGK